MFAQKARYNLLQILQPSAVEKIVCEAGEKVCGGILS